MRYGCPFQADAGRCGQTLTAVCPEGHESGYHDLAHALIEQIGARMEGDVLEGVMTRLRDEMEKALFKEVERVGAAAELAAQRCLDGIGNATVEQARDVIVARLKADPSVWLELIPQPPRRPWWKCWQRQPVEMPKGIRARGMTGVR